MHRSLLLLLAAFAVVLAPSAGFTQPPFPIENHYKVYFVQPNPSISGRLRLDDQWGTSQYDLGAVLFNFANPVQKNGSQIFFPLVHHTWWFLPSNNPTPSRTVQLENQFGRQIWTVNYAEYLLVPASKSLPPQEPPAPLPPNTANHYKCYGATGPAVNVPVTLIDQFGQMTGMAIDPAYFCNPVAKTLENGQTFPIVDPLAHLACYNIQPNSPLFRQLLATDQFGTWALLAREPRWLCLPTTKFEPIPVEPNTWGKVKRLYGD